MTIGTGIFLASLVLATVLLYGFTRDRWIWAKWAKWIAFGSLAVIAAATTAAVSLYYWNEFPSPIGKQTQYADLQIGMSRDEVLYIKGLPAAVIDDDLDQGAFGVIEIKDIPKGKRIADYNRWVYRPYSKSGITLFFNNERTKLIAIQCFSDDNFGWCPSIGGIRDGTSEEEAVRRIGSSGAERIEGTIKTITYPDIGIKLSLAQKRVYMIRVGEPGAL